MPNRIIKESIRTSKSVNTMTDFQFRMWAYLLTYVDDFGRGSADPEILKGFVFPRRKGLSESTIEKTLAELATIGSILLYKVDGESYLCFPRWSDHQRIQQKKSKFPEPPEEVWESRNSTVDHGEPPPESNPNPNPNPNPNLNPKGSGRAARFSPPSVLEVQDFIAENGFSVDAQHFVDYYTSNGWKVGKNPMKDWQATVRSWQRRESQPVSSPSKSAKPNPALDYEQRTYSPNDFGDGFFIDLEKEYGSKE